ncbi:hypothetical protein RRM65_000731 [Aeromonas salmonicida subsp. salmonicida]|nr:hypothetical protein [Aeromonas salmonicida subsp. salmonicida]
MARHLAISNCKIFLPIELPFERNGMIEQPQWNFLKQPLGAKARDPMQDEFFQDQSIEGLEHALVRETIQNSLDARLGDDPVLVALSLGKLSADNANFWFPKEVQDHYSAKEIRLASLPNWGEEECIYLAIEDFGTKGLEGEIDSVDPQVGGNFYHFFRAEGLSNKKDGERGSWGVGKIVIPRSSRIRTFFAITRRASETGMHLIGQTILRHHEINGVRYTPDGWLSQDKDGLQIPFTSDMVTERLRQDFRLRRVDEPGLSVVIPWAYEKYLTLDRLAAVIAKEYFIPILAGDLVIELRDHNNDSYQRFDSSSFSALIQAAPKDDLLQEAIQLARNLLRLGQVNPLEVKVIHKHDQDTLDYDWSNYQTDLPPQDIESALEHNLVVHFKVPMIIIAAKGDPVACEFDVLVKRKSGRHYPIYVRDGLIIPNQPTRRKAPDCIGLIYTSDNAIAESLRRAECPAHTDWKASRDKFREPRYHAANKLIPFVRESIHKLIDKLSSDNDQPDHNLLADLLPYPSNNSPLQPKCNKVLSEHDKKTSKTTKPDDPDIPLPTPRCWRLKQYAGEIYLTGNPDGFTNKEGYRLILQAAYDIHGRNPFKTHSKFDFDLKRSAEKGIDDKSGFRVVTSSVQIESGDYGSLVVQVSNPDFEIIFQPADLNRDLIMKISSTPIGEDEVVEITE